ncbi:recombination mediator RecR [Flavobacteriaceae bacterium]|nr:recombination mediator RecR [Flavobacteriaceae bacterium]
MDYSSKILEQAVSEISGLPGIGKRSALRLALHLLKQDKERAHALSEALVSLVEDIKLCKDCHNIADTEICHICASHNRQKNVVCVVEDVRDVMAIENTGQFKGVYHVLGGKISPLEGIGPNDLFIESLLQKSRSGAISELIFALSSTMEGDTTNFYIYKQIEHLDIKVSAIARGIAVGDELEYADELTLGRSIINRVPFENSL